jgi:hypothetical protein
LSGQKSAGTQWNVYADGRRSWRAAHEALRTADEEEPLRPEDRERHALAAFLVGKDFESDAERERAHRDFLDQGDVHGAGRDGWPRGGGTAWSQGPKFPRSGIATWPALSAGRKPRDLTSQT